MQQSMRRALCMVATCAAVSPAGLFAQDARSVQVAEENVLEEVVVTATRRARPLLEVAASVTVQNVTELEAKGFTYGTDEFRGVPGVFFRRGEGDGEEFPFISIRGVTGNHGNDTFLAMVDGIPFVGADEEVLMYEVPYPAVENIEIVRGPVSALYGRGAIAGAVNYRTRDISESQSEVAVSLGTEGLGRFEGLLEHAPNEDSGVMISAVYEDFDGWRENSERTLGNVFVKGQLALSDDSSLTGWLNYFSRDAEIPSVIPTLADGTIVDVIGGDETFLGYLPTQNDSDGWIAAARYETTVFEGAQLQVTAQARSYDSDVRLNFYDYFEFDPANNIMGVNGFASQNETDVLFAEATLSWEAGKHQFVAGISGEKTELDEADRWSGENDPFFSGECGFRFYAILIDYSTAQVVNDSPDNPCFVRDQLRTVASTTNTFYGAFIQDEIQLTDKLELTLGLRYDAFDREVDYEVVGARPVDQRATGDESALSPKASLAYHYGGGMVYGSYGRGFSSNFGPVFQWEPDRYARDEQPTTIDSFEIGWKGQAADGMVTWETALFYLLQKDRRIFVSNPDPVGPPTLATTGQEYSSRGLEVALQLQPWDRTTAIFSYTYLDPEWDELIIAGSFGAPDQDYSGVTPQGVPKNMFYTELAYAFTDWFVARMTYEWYDDYFVDLSNSVKAGSYDLLGLSASIDFPGQNGLSLDLSVTNALDEEYYFYFAGSRTAATNVTPGVPTMARATLRWRF